MGNKQNLTPFNTMPAERHRELSRRGGIVSGAARRAMRERINAEKARIRAEQELPHDEITCIRELTKDLQKIARSIKQ